MIPIHAHGAYCLKPPNPEDGKAGLAPSDHTRGTADRAEHPVIGAGSPEAAMPCTGNGYTIASTRRAASKRGFPLTRGGWLSRGMDQVKNLEPWRSSSRFAGKGSECTLAHPKMSVFVGVATAVTVLGCREDDHRRI